MDGFKFERLDVWKISLEYLDLCYAIAEKLPKQQEYNLTDTEQVGQKLFAKLQAMRRALTGGKP